MKIAIIGAGFSGLSIAWHLLEEGCSVSIFDHKGIGGGASGVAAGLLHPYPGEQGRRSFLATEALSATHRLLKIAQSHSSLPIAKETGIIRYPHKNEVFLSHVKDQEDVTPYDSGFLIRSGMTVFSRRYLEALGKAIEGRGGVILEQKVDSIEELKGFDHVVLAAGAGVGAFAKGLGIEFLKGQVLTCKIPDGVPFPGQSLIGKGYIAHGEEPGTCHFGSTYERGVHSEEPDREKAERELLPKAAALYPLSSSFEILSCQAAFRVARIGHYYPMVDQLQEGLWICTAMGSRGLLYHGLAGAYLKEAIIKNDVGVIPHEFRINTSSSKSNEKKHENEFSF